MSWSLPLGNGNETYPNGDNVQTIEPWEPPSLFSGLSHQMLNHILDLIDKGPGEGIRYSADGRAKDRAAWRVITTHTAKTPAQAQAIIRTWLGTGLLIEEAEFDQKKGRNQMGVRVNAAKRPS